MFWGLDARSVIIEICVEREDCIVEYESPTYKAFRIGDTHFIAAGGPHMPNYIRNYGLFVCRNDTLFAANGESWRQNDIMELVEVESRRRATEID